MAAARALARERRGKHPPIPRQHHPATPSSAGSMTPGGGIEPPQMQPAPGKFSLSTPPQTDRETRSRDETSKIPVRGVRKPRAPDPEDEPRQSKPRREIRTSTRPDRPTDRSTDRPTQSELASSIGASAARSSWPAHPNSGPAPASKAAETAAGRLGRRTGMPAASAAAKAVAGASHGPPHVHQGHRGDPGHLVVLEKLMLTARFSGVRATTARSTGGASFAS